MFTIFQFLRFSCLSSKLGVKNTKNNNNDTICWILTDVGYHDECCTYTVSLIHSQQLDEAKFYVFKLHVKRLILTGIILTKVSYLANAELELKSGLFGSKSLFLMCTQYNCHI